MVRVIKMSKDSLLVISAHSADYVWRAGGVIAKYVKEGHRVKVICLSYGERGESAELWKKGYNLDKIKEIRREESENAAKTLGTAIEFFDWDDYPLIINHERLMQIVRTIRDFKPDVILTHGPKDPFNVDHVTTANNVLEGSILSIANGVMPDIPVIKQPRIFGFEHHQSELSEFYPDVIIDISGVFDLKKQAMDFFQTQKHLIDYYSMRASMRGNHARRVSGNAGYSHAEAFLRYFPYVGGEFP